MSHMPLSSSFMHPRHILEQSPVAYLLLAPDLTILAGNAAYVRETGLAPLPSAGQSLFQIYPVADAYQRKCLQKSLLWTFRDRRSRLACSARLPVAYVASWSQDAVANRCWIVTLLPLVNEQGQVQAVLCHPAAMTDLVRLRQADVPSMAASQSSRLLSPSDVGVWASGMRELDESERHYLHQLFQQAPGFVCVLSGPTYIVRLANDAFYQLIGQRDLMGLTIDECLPEWVEQGFKHSFDQVLKTGDWQAVQALPLKVRRQPCGLLETRYVHVVYQPIREADGEISGIFIQGYDTTDSRELALELSYQISHDALTGLWNRRELRLRVENMLAVEGGDVDPNFDSKNLCQHYLLYLDLDQFRIINDQCGHEVGDRLLRDVADVLRLKVRSDDMLARLGGDEFAVVLRRCPAHAAERVAHQLRQAIGELVFIWDNQRHALTLSMGVVAFGESIGITFDMAMSYADAACFVAKEKGRNRIQVHDLGCVEVGRQLQDMAVLSALKEGLREGRVVLYAQRIVGLQDDHGLHAAWELLARVTEPDGSLIMPGSFIAAAERFGFMPELDKHIVRKAFEILQSMPADLLDSTRYFINVSGRTLSQEDLPSYVTSLLEQFPRVRPHHICFEVTETAAVTNLAVTAVAMQQLVDQGFRFALDDFGSGMSSFAYLRQLPVQYLKIDGEFVRDILENPVDSAMVESVARVARAMGIATVAEFVESLDVAKRLLEIGVDYGQGYALHRPEPLLSVIAAHAV